MQPAGNLFDKYKEAQDFLGAGNLRKSADLCKEILDIDPKFAHGYHLMSSLFRSTGDYKKALNFADMAIDILPNEAVFHMQKGQVLFAMSDWEMAKLAFKKASELEPNNALAVLLWADSLSQQKKFDEALVLFRRARAIQDIPEVDEHEGLCLSMSGNLMMAEMMFDRVIARRPDYDWGYIHKAKMLLDRGDVDAAGQFFSKALERNPNAEEAQLGLESIEHIRRESATLH